MTERVARREDGRLIHDSTRLFFSFPLLLAGMHCITEGQGWEVLGA